VKESRAGGRLGLALALTCGVFGIELAGGLVSHSLALLSDSGHVLMDVFTLALAWFALQQARRPADPSHSYGYHRASTLAALANSLLMFVIVLAIAYEAVRRLMHPAAVEAPVVMVAAGLGIVINTTVVLMLRGHGRSLNLRAAVLHAASDVAASIGVVVAGAIILLTGWLYADPLVSLVIAGLIAYGAWGIARETVHLLLEGTPREIDLDAVREAITRTGLVTGVHDLHVWSLSSEEMALSCHVIVAECPLGDAEHLVRELEGRLCERFAIGHTTIQVESCHPCGEIKHAAGEHNHPHGRRTFTSGPPSTPPRAAESA
jgi:cobalt-zinc-cadmium efflux system protein